MIAELKDFVIVRGLNQTESQYFGDLERITFPQKTCIYRTDGQGSLPYGIDLAWLQECCAERDWTLGRNDVDKLSSFSKVPQEHCWENVCRSVDRHFGQYCFVRSPDIVQGDIIWDVKLTGDWDPAAPPKLDKWCEQNGLKILSSDFQDLPHPADTPFPDKMRPFVLEKYIEALKYGVNGEPDLTGSVTREKIESNVDLSAMQTSTTVGTSTIFRHYREAFKNAGDPWEITHDEKRTVDFPVLKGFGVDFPRQKWSARLIPEKQDLWILCKAHYIATGSPSSSDSVEKDIWAYVKAETASFGISVLGNQQCSKIIDLILREGSFSMDPLSFQHEPNKPVEFADLNIAVHSAWSVITYNDSVTDPRS